MHRQPQPCKFGARCNKFQQGLCKFSHNNDQQSQQGGNNFNGGSNFGGGNRGPRQQGFDRNNQQGFSSNYDRNNQEGNYNPHQGGNFKQRGQNNFNQRRQDSFGQGSRGGFGSKHGNYGKSFNQADRQPNQQQGGQGGNYQDNMNRNNNNQMGTMVNRPDDFQQKFCRSFQWNQNCKHMQNGKCNRIHGFDLNQKIYRVNWVNSIPTHDKSKLGKFQKDGENYFILRMGNQVTVLTLNQSKDFFNEFSSWKFPNSELNYDYYAQKDKYIYLAAANPKTLLYNIYIYDILTGKIVILEEAHDQLVTGVIHFNSQIVLSCSKDGLIRVWKVSSQKGIIDHATSQSIQQLYLTQKKKIQIYFLDINMMGSDPIVSAGTNDGRLLFFHGAQLNFHPITLGQQYSRVYSIKYSLLNGIQCAFVLCWSTDATISSVIAIDFTNLAPSLLLTFDAKQQKNNNINLIEVVDDKLFVANTYGTITIYSLPKPEKVGLIMCKNRIGNILSASYLTQTKIKRNLMFVLENKFGDKSGSMGIYLMKQ